MKIPVVYELKGRRRCLLVQDGETICIGRGETCRIRVDEEGVAEAEMKAQFVNGCQLVVVHPANASVPYAQPLPWKLKLGAVEMELLRPIKPEKGAARELMVQGLTAGETRLTLKPEQPLLLGARPECDLVIPEASCPEVLLALWATAGSKVLVEVLDNSFVVGWLGRANETEAELELPISLSLGGRVILMSSAEAGAAQPAAVMTTKAAAPALAPLPKVPAILAKNGETGPKIVSRQAKAAEGKEGEEKPARNLGPSGKVIVQAATYASSPAPLPPPTGIAPQEDLPPLVQAALKETKSASPTLFILASWLLVLMTFAVVLLPLQPGLVTPEQMQLLWKAAGGTLIVTLILGLGALLK
ncbi:hypothetical protein [Prosthecobacter sp.]|uniref:hypothetical protein n=1 Tax=Prosthecobacter sp. TaxID=1965333 RepID=UPI0037841042